MTAEPALEPLIPFTGPHFVYVGFYPGLTNKLIRGGGNKKQGLPPRSVEYNAVYRRAQGHRLRLGVSLPRWPAIHTPLNARLLPLGYTVHQRGVHGQ